jgi:hypothetical protein
MDEIIKRIDGIKKSIEDAFEKGAIDFDQITGELESIANELQTKESLEISGLRHRKHQSELKSIVIAGDYR